MPSSRTSPMRAQTDGAYQLNDAAHDPGRASSCSRIIRSARRHSQVLRSTDDTGVPIERCADLDRRQRRQDRVDRERLSAGRVEDCSRTSRSTTACDSTNSPPIRARSQASPRLNVVWQVVPDTTLHAGYSRYLSPPPFELVGGKDIALFQNTTNPPLTSKPTPPLAERANYYDVGRAAEDQRRH